MREWNFATVYIYKIDKSRHIKETKLNYENNMMINLLNNVKK